METTTAIATVESRAIILRERCAKLPELYNPANLARTFAEVKTKLDCLALQDAGEPVLKAIAREGGDKQLEATVALNIAALDRFLHLKNPLSEEEIDFIAGQIVDEYGGALTMADIHLVLKSAKAGAYGKFYERLSAPDILSWFRVYYESRLVAAEQRNLNRDRSLYGQPEARTRVKTMTETAAESAANNEYMSLKALLIDNNYKLQEM